MKTLITMKSNAYVKFLTIGLALFLAACSASTPPDDKEARLKDLKAQQDKTAKEIARLESEIAKENPHPVEVKAKDVDVKEIQPQKFDHYVRLQGKIEAEDNIQVSAQTAGLITRVAVTEGQRVTKGQLLAQIDNSLILKNISQLKTQLELANTIYERQKSLWDQKIGTEVQYLQAKNNKESLEDQMAALEQQNRMTRIESPIDGTVDQVNVKIGQSIAPGAPALRVVNTSDLKATCMVSEAYIADIHVGDPVTITLADLNKTIHTHVSFAAQTIDQLSRSFAVEARLPQGKDLLPNMTLVMEVVFETDPAAMVVPINVVQDVNNEKVVYVANQQGGQMVAQRKVVTLVGVYGGQAQVTGLSAGDKVITVGYQGLNEGEPLKI